MGGVEAYSIFLHAIVLALLWPGTREMSNPSPTCTLGPIHRRNILELAYLGTGEYHQDEPKLEQYKDVQFTKRYRMA
jgi:hypothetical protein